MFNFTHDDHDLGYWYIIEKRNTEKELNFKNILCTLRLKGWEFNVKPALFFNIFSGALVIELF